MEEQPSVATVFDDSSAILDFTLETKVGNILTVNTTLAIRVSNDLCMSRGVAKDFKEPFKLLEALNFHERYIGNVLVFFDTALNRYNYYFKIK